MKLEHEALRKAHASLAAEGAVRQQLVDSLGETAREVSRASETSTAALVADLAAAEHNANEAGGERDTLRRELSSERAEHGACRLQLISAQAALQRRADSADAVATEGVRLTLALDEAPRADRLAGVIHRPPRRRPRRGRVAGGGGGGGGGLLFGEGGGGGLWGGSASLRASRTAAAARHRARRGVGRGGAGHGERRGGYPRDAPHAAVAAADDGEVDARARAALARPAVSPTVEAAGGASRLSPERDARRGGGGGGAAASAYGSAW